MLNGSLYMLLLISIVLGWLREHYRLVVSSLVTVVVYSGIVSVSVVLKVHNLLKSGIWQRFCSLCGSVKSWLCLQ